jgi:hypothetical protein
MQRDAYFFSRTENIYDRARDPDFRNLFIRKKYSRGRAHHNGALQKNIACVPIAMQMSQHASGAFLPGVREASTGAAWRGAR